MNKTSPWSATSKLLFRIALKGRKLIYSKICWAFGSTINANDPKIGRIYVINLDREPDRWKDMQQELSQILDCSGASLFELTKRYDAVDAKNFLQDPQRDADVDPVYTLGDQLFVEPQPAVLPTKFELDFPIRMSRPEIAVARSHINIWKQVVAGSDEYVLILEDDVWFKPGFATYMDQAWTEVSSDSIDGKFDILYLSYEEVKHGAPKTFLSRRIFHPERGLWYLSGYVVSRKGAKKLLQILPCRGPVDLWINHQFSKLKVRALKKSIIGQRPDRGSTNSYSILPSLTKIGAITSESASLFHVQPTEFPVFVFGPNNSGLSSIAMALAMLGYRCCSDLDTLPNTEFDMLISRKGTPIFNAYVNIGSLEALADTLKGSYPRAKFIITTNGIDDESYVQIRESLRGADLTILHLKAPNKWKIICQHLRCAPPASVFPVLVDHGQRKLLETLETKNLVGLRIPKRDGSPWIVDTRQPWNGIRFSPKENKTSTERGRIKVNDFLEFLDTGNWFPRNDTFTDNLALFRSENIGFDPGIGAKLCIKKEPLGVREYSAASLTSCGQFLYGRFEVMLEASGVPGAVTGFFLHRDSPRQEIDVEIAGNRPDRLIVNVFYNPGGEGAKFDYGYRGTPSYIDLGFDASKSFHKYTIEWGPHEIRWLVDDRVVHIRGDWNPTPIPHLPMALHVNIWPCRSRKFAGQLIGRKLPATTFIRFISLEANH